MLDFYVFIIFYVLVVLWVDVIILEIRKLGFRKVNWFIKDGIEIK